MTNIIATEVQTQELDSPLVDLFDLELSDGSILYFHPGVTESLADVIFRDAESPYNLRTYTPLPMVIDGLDLSADGSSSRPTLTVANVSTLFKTALGSFKYDDLVGVRVTHRRTFAKYLVGGSAHTTPPVELRSSVYIIDRIASETNTAIVFEMAVPYDLENIKLPRRVIIGKYCSWKYQGNDINKCGGCTWLKNGSTTILDAANNTNRVHSVYFDIEDKPLISATPAGTTTYSSSTSYTLSSYALYASKIWQCLIAHTNQTPGTSSSYWKESYIYTVHNNSNTSYSVGDHVKYSDTVWRCLAAHNSSVPSAIVPENKSTYWVRADVCGKTLNSCKSRFQYVPAVITVVDSAPSGAKNTSSSLPFGAYPGTAKF